jgi:exoribonuclease-2
MLPPELSTDRTSLNEGEERLAIVTEMTIDKDANIVASDIYRARVRNQGQLAYNAVAAWLDGTGPAPDPIKRMSELEHQLRLQDQLASRLQERREKEGALDFDRVELKAVVDDHGVHELDAERSNRAKSLIENLMVAANGVSVRFLSSRGCHSIRRVVRSPERRAPSSRPNLMRWRCNISSRRRKRRRPTRSPTCR